MKEIANAKGRGRMRAILAAAGAVVAVVLSALAPATAATAAWSGSEGTGDARFQYYTHIQDYGWTDQGGTMGRSLRLEAVNVFQRGSKPICMRAHVQDFGWMAWKCTNGKDTQITVGSTGMSLRVEAISIMVPSCKVNGFVVLQDIGVRHYDTYVDTLTMGTTGEWRRLEALYFNVKC